MFYQHPRPTENLEHEFHGTVDTFSSLLSHKNRLIVDLLIPIFKPPESKKFYRRVNKM